MKGLERRLPACIMGRRHLACFHCRVNRSTYMNIIVPLKQVPDLVEELQIDESGRDLNREWLKYKLNEFDEHALEEALLLKEELGGQVTAIALESEEIDN